MRAAIYARYSTEMQSDASIDDQVRQCRAAANAAGLEVAQLFEDRGISAGTAQRPGYQAMLAAARSKVFDVIVVEDISRLWRSSAEYGPRAAELEDLGMHLVTCVGDDTRREGWGLMLGIKQAMAEHNRREISYRTRRGMEGLALAGKSTGGRVYGYKNGAVDPVEADVVRRIFAMIAVGRSQGQAAKVLNAAGIPSARGGKWIQSTISGVLRNERYLGAVQWGASTCKAMASDSKRRRRLMRSEGPLVSRQDDSLRIISDDLWAAVQEKLARPNGTG